MRYLLTASHWQIALMQLIPILCIFFLDGILTPLQIGFMWILLVVASVVWLLAIGLAANRLLGETLRKNETVLRITAIACPILFTVVMVIMFQATQSSVPPPRWLIYVLFSGLGCFFYTLWFAASQFVAAENKSETFYIEYAFPMIGFWFGFVGAWFLQPRVNKVLGS